MRKPPANEHLPSGLACAKPYDMASEELLTSREVADEFRVHRATVLRWAREGIVPAIRLPGGKAIRFRRSDIEAALATPAAS